MWKESIWFSEFLDARNETGETSVSESTYKYPFPHPYNNPNPNPPKEHSFVKAEEPKQFTYQRANSFHEQNIPKEEVKSPFYQQESHFNQHLNDPTFSPKKESNETIKMADLIHHPSVIQGPSSGVIRSLRTSVIQHSHSPAHVLPRR